MDYCSKQISSSTATAMAKRPHNTSANEIEELVSDSDVEFASDDSGKDFTHDFTEHSDGTVEADEEWQEKRGDDKATAHHFTGPDPELIHVVAPDINEDSSSFDFFRLIFTEELFSTILTHTNHYYQQHTQKTISYIQDYNIEIQIIRT
jgi:hypothetical protein